MARALVDLHLAVAALVAGQAAAAVLRDPVHAGGAVLAGPALALVNVYLTVHTCTIVQSNLLFCDTDSLFACFRDHFYSALMIDRAIIDLNTLAAYNIMSSKLFHDAALK